MTKMVQKLTLAALFLTLAACSGGGGGGGNGDNGGNNPPPTTVPGSATDIVIDPVNLEQPDFGRVTTSSTINAFINIRNAGTGVISPVKVSLTGLDASSFNLVSASCPDLQPAGGNLCTVQIQFSGAGKLNRIYFAQLDVNGIKFPLSAELAIQSSGVSDYQLYQNSQFVASSIDLGKTDTNVLQQTVVLRHLLRSASGNLPIVVTDPAFQLSRTSCPAVEINRTGCPITITFNPQDKASRVYTAPLKIGSGNPIPVNVTLRAEKAAGQAMADFQFYVDNTKVSTYTFGTVTVPEKKMIEITIKNEGQAAGVPNLNIMPNQIYMIGDNSCAVSVAPGASCSVKIYATSLNRLANTYQSKLFAANNSMNLEAFVYTPNKCLPGTHLDPDSLICLPDRQTEIVANGTRSRSWFPAPLPGSWDAWAYSCLEPKFELNATADGCIAKRRILTLETEGTGTITGGTSGTYDFDTVITLKANPGPNYVFKEWAGGSCFGSTVTCTVVMNQSHTVRAVFYVPPLQINPNPIQVLVGSGIILSTSGGVPPYQYEMAQDALGSVNPTTGQYSGHPTPTQGAIRVRDSENRVVNVSLKVARGLMVPSGVFNVTTNSASILGATDGFPPYTFTKNSGVGSPGDGVYNTGSVPGSAFVTVTDGLGTQRNVNVNVVAPLEVTPSSIASEIGKNIPLSINYGITPYNIQLLGVQGGNPVGSMQGQTYRIGNTAGTALIKVTDSMNNIVQVPVVVVPVFALGSETHHMVVNSSWQIALGGGLGPFTYTKVSGPGTLAADGFFTAFGVDGTTLIDVTDSLGTTKRQTIKIYQPLNIGFTNFKMLVGQQKIISPTGGATPYTISLKSGAGSISNGNTYSSTTVTSAVIKVTDSVGLQTVEGNIEVLPEFKLPALSVNLVAGSTYQIVPTGGLAPYSYTLQAGAKGTINGAGLYSAPASQASTDVVEVRDSLGNQLNLSVKVVLPLQVTTPTPDIYINQTANIVVTQGLEPYTYRVSNGLGTITNAGLYTAAGTATVATIEVTDAMGTKVSQNVSVYGAFVVSPLSKNLLINTTQQISVSGGKTPYIYTVEAGPGTISNTGLFTAGATAGDVIIRVKDSLTGDQSLTYKVATPLNISPTSAVVIGGNTVQFTATGGLTPYTYSLTQGVGSISQSGLFSAPVVEGTSRIRLTDAMGQTQNVNIDIIAPLTVPSESIITTVQKIQTISPNGGKTPYFFSMQSGAGTINASGIYTAPTTPGTDVIKVTDSSGLGQQKLITVQVKEGLTISPTSKYLTVNENQQYSAGGGLGPYTYSILSGRGTVNPSTGLYNAGNLPGDAVVRVSDQLDNTAEASVQVLAQLVLGAQYSSMVVGQTQSLITTGGLGPYTYALTSGGGTVSSSGSFTAPATAGTSVIEVTDSLNHKAQITLTIVPQLALGPSGQSMTVNSTKQFTATGGVSPYQWSVLSGTISTSGLYTSPNAAGTYQITVSDQIGNVKQVAVNVVPALTLLINSHIDLLVNQNYTVLVTGGLEPYSFSLQSGAAGTIDNMGVYKAPPTPTTSNDTVTVTDSLGNTKTVTFRTVNPLIVSPTVINLVAGATATITPSQGLPPYTYSFAGSGSFNSATRVYTAPATAGTGIITVKDGLNQQIQVNVNVFTSFAVSLGATSVPSGDRASFGISGGSNNFTVDFIQNANIGSSVRDGFYYPGYTQTNVTEQIRIVDNVTGETKTTSAITVTAMPTVRQKVGTADAVGLRGTAVAMSDSYLVVGSPNANGTGSIEIYTRSSGTWTGGIVTDNGQADEQFGASVAVKGTLVAVGSPRFDGAQTDSGRVSLFRFNGSTWNLEQQVAAPVPAANEYFGYRVTLFTSSGIEYLAVASNSNAGGTDAGAVYVFRNNAGNWTSDQVINGTSGDKLGFGLSSADDHLIIGVPSRDYSSKLDIGEVVVVTFNGASYSSQVVRPSDAFATGNFGYAVAVDKDGRIIVGAPNRNSTLSKAGAVYSYYKKTDGTYAGEIITLDAMQLANGGFGSWVGIIEDYMAASNVRAEGVSLYDYKNAYVYRRSVRGNTLVAAEAQNFGKQFAITSAGIVSGISVTGEVHMFTWDLTPNWPTGTDGDLIITSGQTIQMTPGTVKNYRNVRIEAGGVLEITDGSDWTLFGVQKNLRLDGVIRLNNATHTGGTFNRQAPDRLGALTGETLSYVITQQPGGSGGSTRQQGIGGGGQAYGNGGGGGGEAGGGGGATLNKGGDGGPHSGGAGSSNFGVNGNNAGGSYGGGGGGFRGKHGQAIYLKVKGNVYGSGQIITSGQNGTAGGVGSGYNEGYTYSCNPYACCAQTDAKGQCIQSTTCYNTCNGTYYWGGGGGGGGAGGSGGKISLRCRQENAGLSFLINGGAAGSGNAGGNGAPAGASGSNGAAGSLDVSNGNF
jgi:hypothetical protein